MSSRSTSSSKILFAVYPELASALKVPIHDKFIDFLKKMYTSDLVWRFKVRV